MLDFLDGIGGAFSSFGDTVSGLFDGLWDTLVDILATAIGKFFYFVIVKGLLSVVNIFYRLFAVFAGMNKVEYDGDKDYLINVFFSNSTINYIYWGMALIGIALVFAFSIAAVIKKAADLNDKMQKSLGNILTDALKSILIICSMSLIMNLSLSFTNVLLQTVNRLFDTAYSGQTRKTVTYSNAQYSTMLRCLATIGNYANNETYNSRYNVNSCFNDIRADLYSLQQDGVFDVYYVTEDENGNEVQTWQSVLQSIVLSADLRKDVKLDMYNDSLSYAMINAMELLRDNETSLQVLQSYEQYSTDASVPLDVIIFLSGTADAALNSGYNVNPSFSDGARGPFFTGEKSIYNLDDVSSFFSVSIGRMSYILIALMGCFVIRYLWRAIIMCVTRIFSLLGLYVIAPPFIAVMPLDDGAKFKQWFTAFLVQLLGIFGTIIPMRLLLVFIPIIFSSSLVIFADSGLLNIIAKVLLVLGGLEACNRFGGIITGIVADMAGWQTVSAGNTDSFADSMMDKAKGSAGFLSGASTVSSKVSGYVGEHYGIVGSAISMFGGKGGNNGGGNGQSAPQQQQQQQQQQGPLPASNHNLGGKS